MSAVRFRAHDVGPVRVVTLTGDIDSSSAAEVQEHLREEVQPGRRVLIDLSGVPYMSSAGLRTMLLLHRHAQAADCAVGLVGVSDELRGLMSATGFLSFFSVGDTVDECLAGLGGGTP